MHKLQILLNSLPDNADDIAMLFRLQGICGMKNSAFRCPIAEYLAANGVDKPSVGRNTAFSSTEGYVAAMPMACQDFVTKFDGGWYEDLEAE